MTEQTQKVTSIPGLKVIEFFGEETRKFLQGQLSCDMEKLAVNSWCWGGYLSNKGRLLATFVVTVVADDHVVLVMDENLVIPCLAKFKMYLLRAKTKPNISEMPIAVKLGANEGEEDKSLALKLTSNITLLLDAKHPYDEAVDNLFHIECVNAGMPWLTGILHDQLTAHMLSLDLIGGVDFEKGCYVGQEILIRSHHRGKIKKRAFIVEGAGDKPVSGTEILSHTHNGQVAGHIFYAAKQDSGFIALAAIRKDAVEGRMELADGRDITAKAPPYGLIDEKFEKA